MEIRSAKFVASYPSVDHCPPCSRPEFAFIGRSNVGKSSLINMLTGVKSLAKVSQTPGKTRSINYFDIDGVWHLVDLPGYGFVKASRDVRRQFSAMVNRFIEQRPCLYSLFVLVDARHEPQTIDLEFINWAGQRGIPFAIIFTKADKISATRLQTNVNLFKTLLGETWDELPQIFVSSAVTRLGKDQLLNYIQKILKSC